MECIKYCYTEFVSLEPSVYYLVRNIVLFHAAAETWGIKLAFRAHELWGHAATCWSTPANAGITHGLQYDMVETTDVCLHFVEICEHKLLLCVFLGRSVTWICRISLHRASMEITSNERWSQHSPQLCSDLFQSSDLWSTAKQTFNDGFSSLRFSRTQTHNTQKYKIHFPPLFGLLSLPIKCMFIMYVDMTVSKCTTHPLVQYVSKQQCLKNGTALSFSIADCETG